MARFRTFINRHPFDIVLREEGEAPAPTDPQQGGEEKTHNDSSKAIAYQLGIEPDDFEDLEEEGTIEIANPRNYMMSHGWPFLVKPPLMATVKNMPSGTKRLTFHLSLLPKTQFYFYKGGVAMQYNGEFPVKDRTEEVSKSEYEDMKADIYKLVQPGMMQAGGGMGGGMGGAPMGMM